MDETNNLKIDITSLEEILSTSKIAIHEIISIQPYASQNQEATTTSLEADIHRVSSIFFHSDSHHSRRWTRFDERWPRCSFHEEDRIPFHVHFHFSPQTRRLHVHFTRLRFQNGSVIFSQCSRVHLAPSSKTSILSTSNQSQI